MIQQTMKMKTELKVLVLITALFFELGLSAQTNHQLANSYFTQGHVAYKAKNYNNAAELLERSYSHLQHSLTAYLLAATYCKKEDKYETKKYCELARSLQPPLASNLTPKLDEALAWANSGSFEGDGGFRKSGEGSSSFRSTSSSTPPPKAPGEFVMMNIDLNGTLYVPVNGYNVQNIQVMELGSRVYKNFYYQGSGQWVEVYNGQVAYTYVQRPRESNAVVLEDASRNLAVWFDIPTNRALVSVNGSTWGQIFSITGIF